MKHILIGLCLVGQVLFYTVPVFAQPQNPQNTEESTNYAEQAQSIASLRTEVSLLQEEIRDERSDQQNRLRTLEAQRSDVALQLRRQKAMTKEVRDRIAKQKTLALPEESEAEIDAVLIEVATQLKADIRSSIPYRHQERLQSVDEILFARESNTLTAMQAATRLWAVAEDEQRLNRENQLDSLTLSIDEKDVLVDVVRIGMMFMLYQTKDGQFGVWSQKNGWSQISTHLQEFDTLFRQFRKGIRSGAFFLPLHLESL